MHPAALCWSSVTQKEVDPPTETGATTGRSVWVVCVATGAPAAGTAAAGTKTGVGVSSEASPSPCLVFSALDPAKQGKHPPGATLSLSSTWSMLLGVKPGESLSWQHMIPLKGRYDMGRMGGCEAWGGGGRGKGGGYDVPLPSPT